MPARKIPIETRLANGWSLDPTTGCHVWQKNKTSGGYGVITERQKSLLVHRVSYSIAKGEIPDGLEIDHLCRNRACVNPDHLEAVTQAENIRRAGPAVKGFCKRGHPFNDGNTALVRGTQRVCKTCARLRAAAHYWGGTEALAEIEARLHQEVERRKLAEAEVARLQALLSQHGVRFHDDDARAA